MRYLDDYGFSWNKKKKKNGCRREQTWKQNCEGWSAGGRWRGGWWRGNDAPSPQRNRGVEGGKQKPEGGGGNWCGEGAFEEKTKREGWQI